MNDSNRGGGTGAEADLGTRASGTTATQGEDGGSMLFLVLAAISIGALVYWGRFAGRKRTGSGSGGAYSATATSAEGHARTRTMAPASCAEDDEEQPPPQHPSTRHPGIALANMRGGIPVQQASPLSPGSDMRTAEEQDDDDEEEEEEIRPPSEPPSDEEEKWL